MAFTDPTPVITSVTATTGHVITATGTLGASDAALVMTWWEAMFDTIPVIFGQHLNVSTAAPQIIEDTATIPPGLSFAGKTIKLRVRAMSDGAQVWDSAGLALSGRGFDNQTVVPPTPLYQMTQRFYAVEALGTRGASPGSEEDPVQMEVRLTTPDFSTIIETLGMPSARLWRAATGVWIYQLEPSLLVSGETYVANFRFAMAQGAFRVERQSFKFQAPPATPHDPNNLVLVGTLKNLGGIPQSGTDVMIETYEDIISLATRTGQARVATDAFGNWWFEVAKGSVLRVISGEAVSVVQAPTDVTYVDFADLPSWQPADFIHKDKLGYPMPGQNALFGLGPEHKLYPDGRPLT